MGWLRGTTSGPLRETVVVVVKAGQTAGYQRGKRKSRKGKEHKNKKKEQRKEARATDRARQTMAELVRPYDA